MAQPPSHLFDERWLSSISILAQAAQPAGNQKEGKLHSFCLVSRKRPPVKQTAALNNAATFLALRTPLDEDSGFRP
jgi:hypothetical protein